MDLIPGLPYDIALECLIRVPYHHFSPVSSVCTSWNRQIHLPEFWRRRRAAGFTRKVVVLAQARVDPTREPAPRKDAAALFYRLTACEPETGTWSDLPPVPGYSDGLPLFCKLIGLGSSLVVMGGLDPSTWAASNRVFVYDFLSAKWRRGADMPGRRRLFFACAASDSDNRTVFVAGGHDAEKRALKSAMAYDVADDEWAQMPDMAVERDEPMGACVRGKFHVVGGYPTSSQGRFGDDAESFDAATWRWGPIDECFLDGPASTRIVAGGDGELVMISDGDVAIREECTWRVASDQVPVEVRNTAHIAAWGGKVLVIGSERFGEGVTKGCVLDLKECKWERVLETAGEEYSGHVQSGCCLEL